MNQLGRCWETRRGRWRGLFVVSVRARKRDVLHGSAHRATRSGDICLSRSLHEILAICRHERDFGRVPSRRFVGHNEIIVTSRSQLCAHAPQHACLNAGLHCQASGAPELDLRLERARCRGFKPKRWQKVPLAARPVQETNPRSQVEHESECFNKPLLVLFSDRLFRLYSVPAHTTASCDQLNLRTSRDAASLASYCEHLVFRVLGLSSRCAAFTGRHAARSVPLPVPVQPNLQLCRFVRQRHGRYRTCGKHRTEAASRPLVDVALDHAGFAKI